MKFFQLRFRNFINYFFVLSIAIAHSLDNAFNAQKIEYTCVL